MGEFNEVDRDNNYLAHTSVYKYIERKWKNGRWVYTYDDKANAASRMRKAYQVRLRERAKAQKADLAMRTFNATQFSKERANRRKLEERVKEDARYNKSMEGSYTRRGNRANRAYEHSASARKVIDQGPSGYRGLDVRALRRRNDAIDAANASIKSKKSLKRKVKKAYYKTRDAVKSIPSPINTHKVYKAGNRTTVVDERGPLISTKSNRKNRKKKRG